MNLNKFFFPLLLLFIVSCDKEEETIPDDTPPELNITIPGASQNSDASPIVVSTTLVINISASDASGISLIEAFIDDTKVGEDNTAPYSIVVDISNYASRVVSSSKYREYTLRIEATDLKGNVASSERIINIDNEFPVIDSVSLTADSIINGDSNSVSFSANDNEEVLETRVLINNSLLRSFDAPPYEFQLATSDLSDGPNNLTLEAEDAAGNITAFQVPFIADNTGPNLNFTGLEEGQIIDQIITIAGTVDDEYSGVSSVVLSIGENELGSFEPGEEISAIFNPEEILTGMNEVILSATDNLGNVSELRTPVDVRRRLIGIQFDENYLDPSQPYKYFVIASEITGELISFTEIQAFDTEVNLHAPGEFAFDKPFTITFASLGVNGGVHSYLNSYHGLSRNQLLQIQPNDPGTYLVSSSVGITTDAFELDYQFGVFGADYRLGSQQNGDLEINEFFPAGLGQKLNNIYAFAYNPQNTFYGYQFLAKPLAEGYAFNLNEFSTQGITTGNFVSEPASYFIENSKRLALYGFENQEAYDANAYNQVFSYGFGQFINDSYSYPITDIFPLYSHQVSIGLFYATGPGLPKATYAIPEWTIESTLSGSSITLITSGQGHTIGGILLSNGGGQPNPYDWNHTFESNRSEVNIPVLPPELSDLAFYNVVDMGQLEIWQSDLRQYDSGLTFAEYGDRLVELNRPQFSPQESFYAIFNGVNGPGSYTQMFWKFFKH